MRIGTGLYVKNSNDAVELYKKAFGLELGYHVLNADGTYYHSELYRDGQELLNVIEASVDEPKDNIVQVSFILDSEEEVKNAYALLSEGAVIDTPLGPLPWSPCAAALTDKFGVWWYISAPQHYPDDDFDPTKPLS